MSRRGADHEVLAIEREWQEPRRRCFLVRLQADRLLRLHYYERDDRWTATEVGRA